MTNATQASSAFSQISIAKTFNVLVKPTAMMFRFNQEVSPYIPAVNDSYVFRTTSLLELLSYLKQPDGDAFYIYGPTGSGKTSLLLETAGRLNWPVQSLTCNGRMEATDLIGQYVLRAPAPGADPVMAWQYGPLATAMKLGHILLLNEVDMMPPEELAALNDVLEGKPLVIGTNGGEIIKPHPMFRIVVTANTVGAGDESQAYQGALQQNIASMDRYRLLKVGYPTPAVEFKILKAMFPKAPDAYLNPMIQYANGVRDMFMSGQLSVTFSTRTLLRWTRLSNRFRSSVNPDQKENGIGYALEMSLLRRVDDKPEQREAMLRLARDVFGQDAWVDGDVAEPEDMASGAATAAQQAA